MDNNEDGPVLNFQLNQFVNGKVSRERYRQILLKMRRQHNKIRKLEALLVRVQDSCQLDVVLAHDIEEILNTLVFEGDEE